MTRDLYERYERQIFAYCLHQLGNREEAEDATQTTFMNAFRGLQRGVVPELESAWLYKIAANVVLTRRRSTYRRRRVETPGDLDALQDVLPTPQRDNDELIRLPDALRELPDQQRRALLLREWQGLSYREIADELELSQSAVETLLFRARRSLAAGLTEAPKPKRTRLARLRSGLDLGSLVAAAKALLTGGAAVKVAVTAAAVATTAVTAGTEATRHHVKPEPAEPKVARVVDVPHPSRALKPLVAAAPLVHAAPVARRTAVRQVRAAPPPRPRHVEVAAPPPVPTVVAPTPVATPEPAAAPAPEPVPTPPPAPAAPAPTVVAPAPAPVAAPAPAGNANAAAMREQRGRSEEHAHEQPTPAPEAAAPVPTVVPTETNAAPTPTDSDHGRGHRDH
jgi:RNA polymerase sigma factor (sigma-70 family)